MCDSTLSYISIMISLSGDSFKERNIRYQTATLADIYSKHMLNYIDTFHIHKYKLLTYMMK